MSLKFDYIVVGSGATGAIAAKTLVDKGVAVALLDVGVTDEMYKEQLPNKDFVTLRTQDVDQHRYFLGAEMEGIPWETTRVGSQLTPPRNFLTRLAETILPIKSETFQPLESVAKGGLGGGWGLGCFVYSQKELEAIGLKASEMTPAYQSVISHIGVSGAKDDATPYCLRNLLDVQAVTELGENAKGILAAYEKKKQRFHKQQIYVGRSALALLTQDKDDRKAVQYKDMGFWGDGDKSAYRSWITIEQLEKKNNFSYHKNCCVLRFEETDAAVRVYVKRVDTNDNQVFECKKLILAPGVLNSARIVSRSFDYKKERMPIICNPYSYMPCLQWRRLGKGIEQKNISFSQLMLFVDKNNDNFDVSMASLFSYRSLLLFKLIKEAPLNFADSRILMQFLHSAFTIAGVHHPEWPSSSKYMQMEKNADTFSGDVLHVTYKLSDKEQQINRGREKDIQKALSRLGCQSLKTIQTPMGASVHYAGSLPFCKSGEHFTITPKGKLGGTKNVYVADGSGFRYLPAKGLTLTLMANAHRVAKNVLEND